LAGHPAIKGPPKDFEKRRALWKSDFIGIKKGKIPIF